MTTVARRKIVKFGLKPDQPVMDLRIQLSIHSALGKDKKVITAVQSICC